MQSAARESPTIEPDGTDVAGNGAALSPNCRRHARWT